MEEAWRGQDKVRGCVTLEDLPEQDLDQLPPVETIFEPPDGRLAYLACDGRYFSRFGAKLLASIEEPSHVHLMDADPAYAKHVIETLGRPVGLTVEQPKANAEYYHSVRFCRLAQMLEKRAQALVLLDVDAIANGKISALPDTSLGMRLRPARLEPWHQCNASVVIAGPDALPYFRSVADYIFHFWKRGGLKWQIDQLALYIVWQKMGVDIQVLDEAQVNYDYRDDAVIWCNSGSDKWRNADEGRQKYRDKFESIAVPSSALFAAADRADKVQKVAYLSCELYSRDLDNRLLIASYLCDIGVPTVVGHFWGINGNMGRAIPGCYVSATMNDMQVEACKRAMETGNYVIATDCEGLPLKDPLPNISAEAPTFCDRFLVDSEVHFEQLTNVFEASKFRLTGSPRIELLSMADPEPIPGEPYVLFNTGLAITNSVWGSVETALSASLGALEVSKDRYESMVKSEQASIELISPLIRWLAPQMRVVIRPHPNENPQTWIDAFPNVEVAHRTPAIPWMRSARLVIHANSTTGIEAAALGAKVLNLNPLREWGKYFTIDQYNYTVRTLDEAVDAIVPFLRDDAGPIADFEPQSSSFLIDGAKNTAREIADILKDAPHISSQFTWTQVERAQKQIVKFQTSLQEVEGRLRKFGFGGKIDVLDDSTFFLSPKT